MKKHIAGFLLFAFIVSTFVVASFAVNYAISSFSSPAAVEVATPNNVDKRKKRKKRKKRRCRPHRHEWSGETHYGRHYSR